jgi:hypothetical protein
MDVEVADQATGGTEDSPVAAAGWVVLVMSFPRELCAGGIAAGALANIEEAHQRAEGDLAVGRAFEGQMRFLDERKSLSQTSISTMRQRPANALAKDGSLAISRAAPVAWAAALDCRPRPRR